MSKGARAFRRRIAAAMGKPSEHPALRMVVDYASEQVYYCAEFWRAYTAMLLKALDVGRGDGAAGPELDRATFSVKQWAYNLVTNVEAFQVVCGEQGLDGAALMGKVSTGELIADTLAMARTLAFSAEQALGARIAADDAQAQPLTVQSRAAVLRKLIA